MCFSKKFEKKNEGLASSILPQFIFFLHLFPLIMSISEILSRFLYI